MWTCSQAKHFVIALRKGIAEGWFWMTPEVRSAMAEQKVLHVVLAQVTEQVSIEAIRELRREMLAAAGCLEET